MLLLAGPGVVVGAALTAVFAKYAFPYHWSWLESLLFGAMLSATDPVAVIALLQEVSQIHSSKGVSHYICVSVSVFCLMMLTIALPLLYLR